MKQSSQFPAKTDASLDVFGLEPKKHWGSKWGYWALCDVTKGCWVKLRPRCLPKIYKGWTKNISRCNWVAVYIFHTFPKQPH